MLQQFSARSTRTTVITAARAQEVLKPAMKVVTSFVTDLLEKKKQTPRDDEIVRLEKKERMVAAAKGVENDEEVANDIGRSVRSKGKKIATVKDEEW